MFPFSLKIDLPNKYQFIVTNLVKTNIYLMQISHYYKALCTFDIGTLTKQEKHEKLFWECIFALLNLKSKINIEGQHVC